LSNKPYPFAAHYDARQSFRVASAANNLGPWDRASPIEPIGIERFAIDHPQSLFFFAFNLCYSSQFASVARFWLCHVTATAKTVNDPERACTAIEWSPCVNRIATPEPLVAFPMTCPSTRTAAVPPVEKDGVKV
jgi:hypothetical protein